MGLLFYRKYFLCRTWLKKNFITKKQPISLFCQSFSESGNIKISSLQKWHWRTTSQSNQQNIKCTTHTVQENIRRKDSKRSTAQSLKDSSTSLWLEIALTTVRSNWLSGFSSRPWRSSTSSLIRTHWRSFSRLSCREEPERTQRELDPVVPSDVKPSM